jgi:hypothetical protein
MFDPKFYLAPKEVAHAEIIIMKRMNEWMNEWMNNQRVNVRTLTLENSESWSYYQRHTPREAFRSGGSCYNKPLLEGGGREVGE